MYFQMFSENEFNAMFFYAILHNEIKMFIVVQKILLVLNIIHYGTVFPEAT